MAGPIMIDKGPFDAAGLPLTKKSLKYSNTIDQNGRVVSPSALNRNLSYESIVSIMQHHDLREFIQRYQWVNVPKGLNAELIERILYFRGKGILYYNDEIEEFQFLPFALNKTIDVYGRFTRCNSLPFLGVSQDEDNNSYVKQDIEIVYDDLFIPDELNNPEVVEKIIQEWSSGSDKGIIINDSSLGLSQTPPIRYHMVQPILASLATCYQIINTTMFAAADYNLIQTQNEAEYESLMAQLSTINNRILAGHRFGAVVGTLQLNSLKTSNASSLQDLWETFNSLDNFRKSTMGVANSGVFNKKERMLQAEHMLNGSNADDIYMDGLYQRQRACDLFNQYYGGNMWVMSKRMPTTTEMGRNIEGDTDDYGTQYYEGHTTGQQMEGEQR